MRRGLNVTANSNEWFAMWDALRNEPLNDEDPCCKNSNGDKWSYMTTDIFSKELLHCFRHLLHPKTGETEFCFIPVSDAFKKAHLH